MSHFKKTVGSRSISGLLIGVFALTLLIPSSDASIMQRLRSTRIWPGHWPHTVLVTGNYARPRLLAEMVQRETNLPIILISAEEMGDEVFYLPKPPEVRQVQPNKFVELIDVFLRPRRIVFIGGDDYIPESYRRQVHDKYPTIVISGDDWIRNARELGDVVRVRSLDKKYRKNLIQLLEAEAHRADGGGYGAGEPSLPFFDDFEE